MVSSALIDLSQVSVLCVDDDPVMRTVVRAALNQRGCRDIVQAKDGEEALDLCTGRKFDLILCDFHMTPMDGHAFLRELGERGLGHGRPVVMLSAEDDPATIAASQSLGVSAWLAKPISAHRLIERVGAVLGLSGVAAESTDPARMDETERRHTKLLADAGALQDLLRSLPYRNRDRPAAWRAMRGLLHGMEEQAEAIGYTLVGELTRRGVNLLRSADLDPAAATERHAEIGRAVGSIATAIRRVVQNRMRGDGGEMGLRLLHRLDEFVGPVRARLERASPERDAR